MVRAWHPRIPGGPYDLRQCFAAQVGGQVGTAYGARGRRTLWMSTREAGSKVLAPRVGVSHRNVGNQK